MTKISRAVIVFFAYLLLGSHEAAYAQERPNILMIMADDLGFKTYLVADATAAHASTFFDGTAYDAETIHTLALVNLHREFATVLNTADVLNIT